MEKLIYLLLDNIDLCTAISRSLLRGRCKLKGSRNLEEAYIESKCFLEKEIFPITLIALNESNSMEMINRYIHERLEEEANKLDGKK